MNDNKTSDSCQPLIKRDGGLRMILRLQGEFEKINQGIRKTELILFEHFSLMHYNVMKN